MTPKVRNANPNLNAFGCSLNLLFFLFLKYLQMYSPNSAPKMIRKNPSMNRISFKFAVAVVIIRIIVSIS
jgi:hypothetical protein